MFLFDENILIMLQKLTFHYIFNVYTRCRTRNTKSFLVYVQVILY